MPENYKTKFHKLLFELDNKNLLRKISESFTNYFEEAKALDKFDEGIVENAVYFEKHLERYYRKIESNYQFLLSLKEERINIIYEEATYISDVDMGGTSAVKEKMIPSTIKKSKGKKARNMDTSPENNKRKKDFKF